jgi:DNA topoisomerase-3
MKQLIIAEKPSVAADLARVLGKVKKTGDYYEGDQYVIASAIGHLVELFMPEDYDPKWKSWRAANLPILPERFQLKPIEKTKARYQELKKLLSRKDIECVINACDAGREGELIFAYTYDLANKKLPVKRLWMSSMTPEAIRSAFQSLREGSSMQPLQNAAKSRSESDWLIGINGTRAITLRLFGRGARKVATVGRVQTPTLALVVQRELDIRNFKPTAYWKITGRFDITNGRYEGTYIRPDAKEEKEDKEEEAGNGHDKADRIWDETKATAILKALETPGKAKVTEQKKRTRQSAPRLYDLTTLQREANSRFGFPAGMTLKIAQSLYEKHKALTYPRTDSRALPQDYPDTCRNTLSNLLLPYKKHADRILEENRVNPADRRVFNNAQVSDHFAIIPTDNPPKKLTDEEQRIYDMVTRRFLAVFFPPAEYDETTRLTTLCGHTFKTSGKVLVHRGWLEAYDRDAAKDSTLIALSDADKNTEGAYEARPVDFNLLSEQTKAPARYTEATLLSAMEGAGKLVEDEELAQAMKEKGLGTPATRASIIDHLIHEDYMIRENREIQPTAKAEELIQFLRLLHVEELTSPALTGEWEFKLRQVETGNRTREAFMKEIVALTTRITEAAKAFEEKGEDLKPSTLTSPIDGTPLLEGMRHYQSSCGAFKIYKSIGNRKFSEEELANLLRDRKIGPLDGFRSKLGKPYAAMLQLDEEHKLRFVFQNGNGGTNGEGGDQEKEDLSQCPVIGKSPIDGAPVYETTSAYLCATHHEGGKGFRLSRNMLGRVIPREEVVKLLENGETGVIPNFRSNKTKKLFSAALTVDKSGKIGFKFPPREPRKNGKAAEAPAKANTENPEAAGES